MENQNYKTDLNLFEEAFGEYKKNRIALYGLGRYTASIITSMEGYQFVGLMDRDPDNVGKMIYGIPVISELEAEVKADLIIINTAEAYWDTIYNRINHLKTPIFYRNGQRARVKDKDYSYKKLEYWKSSYSELRVIVNQYEVISFDIFDTLIMRKVYSPMDVFRLMDQKLDLKGEIFSHIRSVALAQFSGREYLLDELYNQMQKMANWSDEETNHIKNIELEIEESIITPRRKMVELFIDLQKSGKEIYLISDMYLPKTFIMNLLANCGVNILEDHVIISGEIKLSKKEGRLWSYYASELIKGRMSLHIGDDRIADIENAQREGIATYYVMKASDLLKNSSLCAVEPLICGLYESVIMGLICAKIFEDPFQLNEKKGTIDFEEFEKLGYCWFGNIILTYLLWLQQQVEKLELNQLVFFARDGYFLLEDYNYLVNLKAVKNKFPTIYLPISRRLIMIAAIQDENSLREAMVLPYIGRWEDYLQDRFDIIISPIDIHKEEQINASSDETVICDWLEPYKNELQNEIIEERINFQKLLGSLNISKKAAVIDVGFYGSIQYYLNKLMHQDLNGFYFSADLSSDNRCASNNKMYACFQNQEDVKATSCNIHKQSLVLESFLTAPYGMIRKIDSNGKWVTDSNKQSQDHFQDRINMNDGVKSFMKDFAEIMTNIDLNSIKVKSNFVDILFGTWLENRSELSQKLKDSFYWDNGMVQRRESKIFE